MQIARSFLALLPLAAASCWESGNADRKFENKMTYSLCPKGNITNEEFRKMLKAFSIKHDARLIDRSSTAQYELEQIDAEVLNETGSDVLLVTVEKKGQFSITLTNLGLDNKFALGTRSLNFGSTKRVVDDFLRDLKDYGTIKRVNGGVENDPPC